jgi:hypothetical protein
MSFNPDKTEIMVFSNADVGYNFNFSLNGNNIPITTNYKHLGITLSSDAKWNIHIENIILNVSRHLGTAHLTCRGGLWFLVSFRIFFRTTRELKYIFLFQNLTLGYMTKTLNQIIFFFLHQNQNISFSNIGNQNIFFRKKT